MSSILQAALNDITYFIRFSLSTKGKKYFVYRPPAQRTQDENELWTITKKDRELHARIVADTG